MTGAVLVAFALAGDPCAELAAAARALRAEVGRSGLPPAPARAAQLQARAAELGPLLAEEARAALAEGEPQRRAGRLARIEARAAALGRLTAAPAAAAPDAAARRRALARVLARRDFAALRQPERESGGFVAWLESVLERLDRLFAASRRTGARREGWAVGSEGDALAWALLTAGLVVTILAGVLVARRGLAGRQDGALATAAAAPEAPGAARGEPSVREEEAGRAMASGDAGRAIRALYLALAARLHRCGAIEPAAGRTNWEQARRLAVSRPAAAAPFAQLTHLFDRAVYGREAFGPADFERARGLAAAVEGAVRAPGDRR